MISGFRRDVDEICALLGYSLRTESYPGEHLHLCMITTNVATVHYALCLITLMYMQILFKTGAQKYFSRHLKLLKL